MTNFTQGLHGRLNYDFLPFPTIFYLWSHLGDWGTKEKDFLEGGGGDI